MNSDMPFMKQVALEIIPKAGDVLTMTVESPTVSLRGIRSDCYDDDSNTLVSACRHSKRSISDAY